MLFNFIFKLIFIFIIVDNVIDNKNDTTKKSLSVLNNSIQNSSTLRDRVESVESLSPNISNIEYSGDIYMMRTKRNLLLTQKIKKKVIICFYFSY